MKTTETQEYKKERRKRFGGPIGASMSAMDMNDARKESFEQGVEWCEQQLTARHDKDMKEFAEWVSLEGWSFDYDSEDGGIWERDGYDADDMETTEEKTTFELLALFRDSNKK